MAPGSGPRVLIATLFLPETVNFEETQPSTPAAGEVTTQATGQQTKSKSFDDGQNRPVGVIVSDEHPPSNIPKVLSPIASGENSPVRVTGGGGSTSGSGLLLGSRGSGNAASARLPHSRSGSSDEAGSALAVSRPGSSLAVPTIASLRREDAMSGGAGGSGGPKRPSLPRTASILEDLKSRGTGVAPPTSPKLTPNELELGMNPFDSGAVATPAAGSPLAGTPAVTTNKSSGGAAASASAASTLGVPKRPNPVRLLSESVGTSPALSTSTVIRENEEREYGNRRTGLRSILTPMRPLEKNDAAAIGGLVGSYFAKEAGTPSAPVSSSLTSRVRRRSSSTNRHSFAGGPLPSLIRTHSSRNRSGKNELRRRSSSSQDAIMASPLSPTSETPMDSPNIPPFYFEANPHGNGGLQNAVRSIAELPTRTSSEPTPVTAGSSGSASASVAEGARSRAHIPGTKNPIGQYLWVGTIGCSIGEFEEPLRKVVSKRYLEEKKSAVVWVEDDVLDPAYSMFCKQILWPTFHYQIHDVHKSKAYESPYWKEYKAMNQAFADKLVEAYKPGDLIWVNDYHLLLVPQMIRQKLPHAVVGFFLHISFPSSEIFRCLAVRREILEGMLGADLIGFQTYNTARHFRQTCQRLLSVEATPKGIQLENFFARVGVFPIGIDVKALHERIKDPEVQDWAQNLRERYGDLHIIIARDKLDEIKGVRQKLVAYEAFLERYPHWRGKVVLIQVAMATAEENERQGDVVDLVSRINARFSTFTYQPVVFLHQDVSFSQYLALLQVAEIFINTSLREGMNLTSHEYIICQQGQWGPLLLSEFTGSYSRAGFQRCLAINPYDKLQIAASINEALEMPEEERISRWRDLERHVWSQTAQHWANGFLTALGREVVDVKTRPALSPSLISAALPSPGLYSPTLDGQLQLLPNFDAKRALRSYESAKHRLILLDLEGTLCLDDPNAARRCRFEGGETARVKLGETISETLDQLARDSKNTIYILTGKSSDELTDLTARFPRLGFVSENGCFAALPESSTTPTKNPRRWHKLITGTHTSWRQPVLEILTYYTERTPGSYIDDRGLSIVWRYANTEGHGSRGMLSDDDDEGNGKNDDGDDQARSEAAKRQRKRSSMAGLPLTDEVPTFVNGKGNEAYHWARRQAAEVQNHIMDSLGERFGLQLYPGTTSFLILPRRAGRAIAVAHILQADDFADDGTLVSTTRSRVEREGIEEDAAGPEGDGEVESAAKEVEDARIMDKEPVEDTSMEVNVGEAVRPVSRKMASKQLLEQFDYVLSMGEDQRLCSWLEEMALDKVVTVSVGEKKRGARFRLDGPAEVGQVLKALAARQ